MATDFLEVEDNETVVACTRASGLSDITSITLRLKCPDGTLIERAAVIDDVDLGLYHFDMQIGDFQPGNTFGELSFVTSGGQQYKLPRKDPFRIYTRRALTE